MPTTDSTDLKERLADKAGQAEAPAPVPAQVSPATLVRQAIERQAAAFEAVLPKGFDSQRFGRLVLSAIKATPDLMSCFGTRQGETSVLLAAMQAAAIGLEPNTPTQECWLLPRKNKGVWECQLSIGYRGYLKLARRSGTIKTAFAEVVYERDHFRWERGLEADVLEHRPAEGDRGERTYAYAVVRFMNGGYAFMVLNRAEVEAHRAMSDSWKGDKSRPYSPWTKWPAAMWRKTAVRALVPYMDLSPEAERALVQDDAVLGFNREEGTIEATGSALDNIEPFDGVAELGMGRQDGEPPAQEEPVGEGEGAEEQATLDVEAS